jgi:hypothetical protein
VAAGRRAGVAYVVVALVVSYASTRRPAAAERARANACMDGCMHGRIQINFVRSGDQIHIIL